MIGRSRIERMLIAKLDNVPYDEKPQSRLEKLVMDLNTQNGADTSALTKKVDVNSRNIGVLSQEIVKLEESALLDSNYNSEGDQNE